MGYGAKKNIIHYKRIAYMKFYWGKTSLDSIHITYGIEISFFGSQYLSQEFG